MGNLHRYKIKERICKLLPIDNRCLNTPITTTIEVKALWVLNGIQNISEMQLVRLLRKVVSLS